jgi:hypothetical protein
VSKQSLPTVTIPASNRRRFQKVARVAAENRDANALVLMTEINRANPDGAETPPGSHVGWGGTDRPFGRSDHPISDAGHHMRSLTSLAVSTEREENCEMSRVVARAATRGIVDWGGLICLESTV